MHQTIQSLFSLNGTVALVTGSSRGLGLVLARGLAQAGARVVINGRDAGTVDAAVASLVADGLEAIPSVFDITDEAAVTDAVQRIEESVGPIDVLVNNAGIQIRAPLETYRRDDWDQLMGINLTGPFLVAKAVAAHMISRKRGKIINICSLQSELGRKNIAPYAASKGGLRMLTRGMAVDWAPHNIQVNGIGPGYFVTEMTQPLKDNPEFDAWLCGRTPAARWGDPAELVGAAVFLASGASSYVNGHILYVDGGMLAAV